MYVYTNTYTCLCNIVCVLHIYTYINKLVRLKQTRAVSVLCKAKQEVDRKKRKKPKQKRTRKNSEKKTRVLREAKKKRQKKNSIRKHENEICTHAQRAVIK